MSLFTYKRCSYIMCELPSLLPPWQPGHLKEHAVWLMTDSHRLCANSALWFSGVLFWGGFFFWLVLCPIKGTDYLNIDSYHLKYLYFLLSWHLIHIFALSSSDKAQDKIMKKPQHLRPPPPDSPSSLTLNYSSNAIKRSGPNSYTSSQSICVLSMTLSGELSRMCLEGLKCLQRSPHLPLCNPNQKNERKR